MRWLLSLLPFVVVPRRRLEQLRHGLKCIAMDGGLPIDCPRRANFFDLDMADEVAWFGLMYEPDYKALLKEVREYRADKKGQADAL